MFSQRNIRSFLVLALAAGGLLSLNACEDSGDVASPASEETTILAAGLGLPSAELMVASTRADSGQETNLRQTRARWESEDFDEESHPMHGFLLEASGFLDNGQMVSLVNLVAETREELAQSRQARRDGQRECGERAGRRGGNRGSRQGQGQREGILEYADELGLTEEQIAELTALREELRPDGDQRGQGNRPTEEQREQREELRAAHQARVKEILTDDQWAKFEELREAKREERREQHEGRRTERAAQGLEFLTTLLDLTDEQRIAIEAVLEEQHEKMQALSEEFRSGLEGERPTAEAREAHRAAMEVIREEGRAAIVELLDEEQAELFEALEGLRSHQGRGRGQGRGHGRR